MALCNPFIHHHTSVITISWSLLFSPHCNCSQETVLQLLPDVASSACKYFFMYLQKRLLLFKTQPQQLYLTWEINAYVSLSNTQATLKLSQLCILYFLTVCWIRAIYTFQVSLDHCIIYSWWLVPLWWGVHLCRVPPSVFGWWLHLAHPPFCWDFLKQFMALSLGPNSDLTPLKGFIAVTWQPHSQLSRRDCH